MEQESALIEQVCSEEQKGGLIDTYLPSPAGSVYQEDSVEEVEQSSHHFEPGNNIHEIVLKAQCNATYRVNLDYISGCGSKSQGVSKHKLIFVRGCILWECSGKGLQQVEWS